MSRDNPIPDHLITPMRDRVFSLVPKASMDDLEVIVQGFRHGEIFVVVERPEGAYWRFISDQDIFS